MTEAALIVTSFALGVAVANAAHLACQWWKDNRGGTDD